MTTPRRRAGAGGPRSGGLLPAAAGLGEQAVRRARALSGRRGPFARQADRSRPDRAARARCRRCCCDGLTDAGPRQWTTSSQQRTWSTPSDAVRTKGHGLGTGVTDLDVEDSPGHLREGTVMDEQLSRLVFGDDGSVRGRHLGVDRQPGLAGVARLRRHRSAGARRGQRSTPSVQCCTPGSQPAPRSFRRRRRQHRVGAPVRRGGPPAGPERLRRRHADRRGPPRTRADEAAAPREHQRVAHTPRTGHWHQSSSSGPQTRAGGSCSAQTAPCTLGARRRRLPVCRGSAEPASPSSVSTTERRRWNAARRRPRTSSSCCRVDVRLVDAIPDTATFDVRSTIFGAIADAQPDLVAMGTKGIGRAPPNGPGLDGECRRASRTLLGAGGPRPGGRLTARAAAAGVLRGGPAQRCAATRPPQLFETLRSPMWPGERSGRTTRSDWRPVL